MEHFWGEKLEYCTEPGAVLWLVSAQICFFSFLNPSSYPRNPSQRSLFPLKFAVDAGANGEYGDDVPNQIDVDDANEA